MENTETKVKIETLEDVQRFLKTVPSINCGGCGIAALAIGRWLKKSNLVASAVYVFGQRDLETFNQNARAQADPSSKPGSASHVGVIVYDYAKKTQSIIDCGGTFDITSYSYSNLGDEKFLLKSINACDEWNPSFRRRHVKEIAEALDIDLRDVDLRTKHEYLGDEPPRFYSTEEVENTQVFTFETSNGTVSIEPISLAGMFWPTIPF